MIALREWLKVGTAVFKCGTRRPKAFSPKTSSYSSDTLGSMASQALRDSYKKNFLVQDYMEMYAHYPPEGAALAGRRLRGIFHSDLVQGDTLLEVGSGPSVWCSLVASSRFKHIVLSDIVEANRLELEKWLNKDEDAIDWTTRAEEIADLEGYSDKKKGALEILERTRSAIRKVLPCDVLEPGVLPEEHRETFDVVLSSGCLDSATADHESFRRALSNVGDLAKPGGLLVLVGAGGVKSYPVGNVDFPHANLTKDALYQAVADAGFQMKLYRSVAFGATLDSPDVFRFVLAARKP
ncbi:putative nicotinamide N-methyltransferase [Ixodes scapularis]